MEIIKWKFYPNKKERKKKKNLLPSLKTEINSTMKCKERMRKKSQKTEFIHYFNTSESCRQASFNHEINFLILIYCQDFLSAISEIYL